MAFLVREEVGKITSYRDAERFLHGNNAVYPPAGPGAKLYSPQNGIQAPRTGFIYVADA